MHDGSFVMPHLNLKNDVPPCWHILACSRQCSRRRLPLNAHCRLTNEHTHCVTACVSQNASHTQARRHRQTQTWTETVRQAHMHRHRHRQASTHVRTQTDTTTHRSISLTMSQTSTKSTLLPANSASPDSTVEPDCEPLPQCHSVLDRL